MHTTAYASSCKGDCHQQPVSVERMWAQTLQTWVCRIRPGLSHQNTMLFSTLSDCPKTGTGLTKSESNTCLSGDQQSLLGYLIEVPDKVLPLERGEFFTVSKMTLPLANP